ncbi:hypothetical protein OG455_14365 [Kitasatospora sp. NBC_01287]|uniref:hypothetical protein n=1 Tax=Kitasatospora sp. NBC_01287 TaxID=2903573 RepID=UPI00225C1FF6|nr:hypothetical protein [Kitasatospora sp. NBC_01287]MCX4746688.1 hypothetical protein [Kitasatospora sp. NBC_01287]
MAEGALLLSPLMWHGHADAPAGWVTAVVLGSAVLTAAAVAVALWRPIAPGAVRMGTAALLAIGTGATGTAGLSLWLGDSAFSAAGFLLLLDGVVPMALMCGRLGAAVDRS